MRMIKYIIGDATHPVGDGPKIIVHVCNDVGRWGAGFVLAISRRWLSAETAYRDWWCCRETADSPPFELGQVQFVEVEDDLWVANLIGQHGTRCKENPSPIRYDEVASGLAKVAVFALEHHASIHMPRIGCGLAGGRWDNIEPLIVEHLVGLDVTVYDLV